MHRPQLYRLQYQKKLWGNLKKFWRKKRFSLKSMTKLEDLTVQYDVIISAQGGEFGKWHPGWGREFRKAFYYSVRDGKNVRNHGISYSPVFHLTMFHGLRLFWGKSWEIRNILLWNSQNTVNAAFRPEFVHGLVRRRLVQKSKKHLKYFMVFLRYRLADKTNKTTYVKCKYPEFKGTVHLYYR